VARLYAVEAGDRSHPVTTGVLAVAGGRDLGEGEWADVELLLDASAWRFLRGTRLCLVIDAADWPNVWPTGNAGELSVSSLSLIVPAAAASMVLRESPLDAPRPLPTPRCRVEEVPYTWDVERDALTDTWTVRTTYKMTATFPDQVFSWDLDATCELAAAHPDRARVVARNTISSTVAGVCAVSESTLDLSGTAGHLKARMVLTVSADDAPIATRSWERTFARGLA
jgi:hypothetical protein